MTNRDLPFDVLNGSPGYINLLDALNSWQLVQELGAATGRVAAASFKHVSPAGVAIGGVPDLELRRACFAEKIELTETATAYVKARGADRMSSFGDWAAISSKVDVATAGILRREVSDGIIAPEFDAEALRILSSKRAGRYCVLRVDPTYRPKEVESREVFGVTLAQRRNDLLFGEEALRNVVTKQTVVPQQARDDLLLGLIALKYTQSNSICLSFGGQTIGIGAGQQSRIHCTQLAISKAKAWWLRRHPTVLSLRFRNAIGRPARDNMISQYVRGALPAERKSWDELLEEPAVELTEEIRQQWMSRLSGVCLTSDAYFPFRDNVDHAQTVGVRYVAQPGGSVRDHDVIEACDEHGMVMVFTGLRLFHH